MTDGRSPALAVGGALAIFVLIQVFALALVAPFGAPEYQFVADSQDPTNSVLYVGFLLVVTAAMLAIIKLDVQWLLRATLVFASALVAWYVFEVLLAPAADALGVSSSLLGVAAAVAFGALLLAYPEWYVLDATGVVMGAGAAALLGVNFGVLPAIVLLVALAVYDAISVYGTEHMLTLASSVMDLRVPIILVLPLSLSYSFLDSGGPDVTREADADAGSDAETGAKIATEDGGNGNEDAGSAGGAGAGPEEGPDGSEREREAIFVGLGDAVMPTIMVTSAAVFVDAGAIPVLGLPLNVPALGAMIGTLLGLITLLYFVLKGRPHAGLPLLNGGAVGGYLLGALAAGLSLTTALGLDAAPF